MLEVKINVKILVVYLFILAEAVFNFRISVNIYVKS